MTLRPPRACANPALAAGFRFFAAPRSVSLAAFAFSAATPIPAALPPRLPATAPRQRRDFRAASATEGQRQSATPCRAQACLWPQQRVFPADRRHAERRRDAANRRAYVIRLSPRHMLQQPAAKMPRMTMQSASEVQHELPPRPPAERASRCPAARRRCACAAWRCFAVKTHATALHRNRHASARRRAVYAVASFAR